MMGTVVWILILAMICTDIALLCAIHRWEVKSVTYEMDKGGIHIFEGCKEVMSYPFTDIQSIEVMR